MSRVPPKLRAALKERADERCEICSKPANNWHHRKNKSQGGPDALSNALLLCGSGTTGCHGWVTVNPEMAYRNGWSVPSFKDPAIVPVRRRDEYVLLDDAGNYYPVPAPDRGAA